MVRRCSLGDTTAGLVVAAVGVALTRPGPEDESAACMSGLEREKERRPRFVNAISKHKHTQTH